MRTKSVLLMAFLLAFMANAWAVPPQPANIQQGMQYNLWEALIFPPNEPYGYPFTYLTDGTEEVNGVEAMLLHYIDSVGNKKNVRAYLHTEGSKVYLLHDDQWELLYDFGLQPGDEMQGTKTVLQLL